jgi:hypothetical protein
MGPRIRPRKVAAMGLPFRLPMAADAMTDTSQMTRVEVVIKAPWNF